MGGHDSNEKEAVGPDMQKQCVWKILGDVSNRGLKNLFNKVLVDERMREEWRKSFMISIYRCHQR